MNYCVENNLNLFEFHDAEFSYLHYDGTDLTLSASMVIIHKNTLENPSDQDMEIDSAEIIFKNFRCITYLRSRTWKTDSDGNYYPDSPPVIFQDQDALERILRELQNGFSVSFFDKNEEHGYSIGGIGIDPFFEINFDVDSISIRWNTYKKAAWYTYND